MASAQPIDLEQLRKDVWKYISPKVERITEEQRKQIDDLITDCHERVTAITTTLSGVGETTSPSEVEKLLKPYIDDDTLRAIKGAFEKETLTITIKIREDSHVAKFCRRLGGQAFQIEERFLTMENIEEITDQQIVSLVIELVFLLLGVMGIDLRLNGEQVERVTKEIISIVSKPSFSDIAREFARRVKNANPWEIAQAIYDFIVGWYHLDIMHNIFYIILGEMSWWDRFLVFVRIVALLTATFASGGSALVAQFVLAAENLGRMIQKVENMSILGSLDKKLNPLK